MAESLTLAGRTQAPLPDLSRTICFGSRAAAQGKLGELE